MNRILTITSLAVCASFGTLSAQDTSRPKPGEDPKFLKNAALQVDQYIAAFYRNKKLPVPNVTDDATFLRRAFLVSIGRIPTAEEATSFLEIEDTAKREGLVAYLLKSEGFSSHMTNWAFDLLRIADKRVGRNATNEPYRHWVRLAMKNNMPWDEMTQKLLASKGDGWDMNTASVGYYTRDFGMPLDNLSNTMRVFLGTRMECAQCHDDPFGKTERHDFYQLAAFTHNQAPIEQDFAGKVLKDFTQKQLQTPEYYTTKLLEDKVYELSLGGGGAGQIKLPPDYQYKDAKPGDVVAARTPFGQTVRMSDREVADDGREKMAQWVTTKTGEQFPSVIANRMWKRVMGKGIYEPVDTYLSPDKTNAPELVTYLAKLMVSLEYDLKAFQHVLLLTKTFQFATNPNPSVVEGGDDFNGRKIERLASEQLWDSLITLAAGDPDKKPIRPLDDTIYFLNKPVLVGRKTMSQLSKEVLAIKSEQELNNYMTKLLAEMSDNSSRSSSDSMMMTSASTTKGGYSKDAKVRASELPSPAPRDHFLYLFGASDREVIDSATREPNVGQVLSLMNGFVQRELVNNPNAHLYKSLAGADTSQEKIRRLYIAILNRTPSEKEMSWMLDEVKNQGEAGYKNIVSALVMSSEFLFLQ